MSKSDFKAAGFFIRVAASYLNFFIFAALIFLTVLPLIGIEFLDHLSGSSELKLTNPLILLALIFTLQFIADVALQGKLGWNIGKFILGLKVLDSRNNQCLGIRRMIMRNIFSFVSVLPLGLGILSIAFNPNKKAVHDLISNSYVIHDPNTKVPGFARALITFSMTIVFLVSMLIAPSAIFSTGYIAFNNFVFASKIPLIQSKIFNANPNATITVKLKDKQTVALTGFKQSNAEYIPFRIDDNLNKSRISSQTLKKLGASFLQSKLAFIKSNEDWSFSKVVNIPELILKDTANKDFTLKNVPMHISDDYESEDDENVIGKDILECFDYAISSNDDSLLIKLTKEEKNIYNEKDSNKENRDYKVYAVNKIKKDWQEAYELLPSKLLEELTIAKKSFTNEIELEIESKSGYVTKVKFLKPSKSTEFNDYCQNFLSNLNRFRNIPKSLADKSSFKLKLDLIYDKNL